MVDGEVKFWTLDYDGGGIVHVHSDFVDGPSVGRVDMPFNPWKRARCGLIRREQDTDDLREFEDVRLCRRCVAVTPEDERPTLFEHPEAS